MRADSWAGLVTNASPFALPPGAAVEQVNLTCVVPGELRTRGGMRPVSFVEDVDNVLDCYAAQFAGRAYLLTLRADGTLVALESPAYGPNAAIPQEPDLSVPSGQRAFSYTFRYTDGSYGSVTDTPPTPRVDNPDYVAGIDGGAAPTGLWPYGLNANLLCSGSNKESSYNGGSASVEYKPDLPVSGLCTA